MRSLTEFFVFDSDFLLRTGIKPLIVVVPLPFGRFFFVRRVVVIENVVLRTDNVLQHSFEISDQIVRAFTKRNFGTFRYDDRLSLLSAKDLRILDLNWKMRSATRKDSFCPLSLHFTVVFLRTKRVHRVPKRIAYRMQEVALLPSRVSS
jgi:hypothetical protein